MSEEVQVTTMQKKSIVINKIKFVNNKIHIEYFRNRDGGVQDTITGVFDEPAEPSFYDSMKKLRDTVAQITDIATWWPDFTKCIQPFAVKFKYAADGTIGAVISANYIINSTGEKMALNTPLRYAALDEKEAGDGKHLLDWQTDDLLTLEKEARDYIEGKRAQTTLFDKGEPIEKAEEEGEAVAV